MANKEFIDEKTGKPDDRAWLDHEICAYVESCDSDRRLQSKPTEGRQEGDLYHRFAPINSRHYRPPRPSWDTKIRKIKREMISASIRRLLSNGKIKVVSEDTGVTLSQLQIQVLGAKWPGRIRSFRPINILDAIVDAVSETSSKA